MRGITATRNWILDRAQDDGERWVVFVDDDVRLAGWTELLANSARRVKIDPQSWAGEFSRLFDVMEGVGLRVWGVATQSATRSIYPCRPFLFHTYVTASCMGMQSDLRFDPSFKVKEDYELCLRCLRDDGGVLGARYLYWENDHWSGAGGCATYRTQAMEMDAIKRLIAMYPGMISKVTRGGSEFSIEIRFPGR